METNVELMIGHRRRFNKYIAATKRLLPRLGGGEGSMACSTGARSNALCVVFEVVHYVLET